jgi:protoheme IX farnesyltransferase
MTIRARQHVLWARYLADFWALIKFRQTALLLITGCCSYVLTRGWPLPLAEFAGMGAALVFSISGCTAFNMLIDRDIDARMARTADRPLPAGRLQPAQAAVFAGLLSLAGLGLSLALDLAFALVAILGFTFNLLVYTLWLKRRSPFSILLGGVSGAMPVLAGRVLALGRVDPVGLLLAASILLWIPSHSLALALRDADEYRRAGVPTWTEVYGPYQTHCLIAVASLLNILVLSGCALLLRVHPLALTLLLGMGLAMSSLALRQVFAPSGRRNRLLFKAASMYMLAASILLTAGTVF